MIEIINEVVSGLTSTWDGFARFFEGFARFGLSEPSNAIEAYCEAHQGECSDSGPFGTVLGVVYLLVKMAPGFLVAFVLGRSYFNDTVKGIAVGVAWQIISIGILAYILNLRPTPFELYTRVSTGPSVLFNAVQWHFGTDFVAAFTTWVVIFGAFFLFSYLMWYFINFLLWFVTLTFKQDPIFSDSSAKGHALWLTLTWTFYLTIQRPGVAFVNTVFILAVLIGNRAWQKRKRRPGGSSSSGVEVVDADDQNNPSDDSGSNIELIND